MKQNTQVFDELLKPISDLHEKNSKSRKCSEIQDEQWAQAGIRRVLHDEVSGRGFLQELEYLKQQDISTGAFFEALKSNRRLSYVREINEALTMSDHAWKNTEDSFADLPELENFDMYAGDGHTHKAPIHEKRVSGKVYATIHFYVVNLRSHMMRHLAVGKYGEGRKKEHDMHALKRLSTQELRLGAPKGRKVLMVWDRAGMDLRQWYHWKRQGIYFLTREKELNNFTVLGKYEFNKEDPVNYGIIDDEIVGSSASGSDIRRVTFKDPETGIIYAYVTNLPKSIRPGVVAILYKRRWDIECIFNSFKNKLFEKRAWAVSQNAKAMQANFICITQNLTLILNRKIEHEVGVQHEHTNELPNINDKHRKRQENRRKEIKRLRRKEGIKVSPFYTKACRIAEVSVVFYRWLKSHIQFSCYWEEAVLALRASCKRF